MDCLHYFGYGSLVNRETRPTTEPFEVATVDGWQRSWSHRVNHSGAASVAMVGESSSSAALGFTVLNVEPAASQQIDGVLVSISADDLPALDKREAGYARQSVNSVKSTDPVAMYVSKKAHVAKLPSDYPLLQSYVDCVLAGFLAVFGWHGVDRFFSTTSGWGAPILADRGAPLYPRAVSLSADVESMFDERIAAARLQPQ